MPVAVSAPVSSRTSQRSQTSHPAILLGNSGGPPRGRRLSHSAAFLETKICSGSCRGGSGRPAMAATAYSWRTCPTRRFHCRSELLRSLDGDDLPFVVESGWASPRRRSQEGTRTPDAVEVRVVSLRGCRMFTSSVVAVESGWASPRRRSLVDGSGATTSGRSTDTGRSGCCADAGCSLPKSGAG